MTVNSKPKTGLLLMFCKGTVCQR